MSPNDRVRGLCAIYWLVFGAALGFLVHPALVGVVIFAAFPIIDMGKD